MENTIIEAAKINRLSSENAVFEIKNGFLTMTSKDLDPLRAASGPPFLAPACPQPRCRSTA